MKKLILISVVAISMLTGCTANDKGNTTEKKQNPTTQVSTQDVSSSENKEEVIEQEISTEVISEEITEEATKETNSEETSDSVLASFPKQFVFSSGAGAWGTFVEIAADGTFKGDYHDSNMGEMGDNYPNGTIYYCNFTGKFSTPEKIDEYSYSMRLESIDLDGIPDEETFEDGVRYVYSLPYGLENADEVIIYLPGYKVSDLPEEFVSWSDLNYRDPKPEILPYYGLYNVTDQNGFIELSE